MTLKQKILLLPVLALVVFGAGLIIGYLNATRTEAIIDRVGRVEYQSFVRLQQADAAFKAI